MVVWDFFHQQYFEHFTISTCLFVAEIGTFFRSQLQGIKGPQFWSQQAHGNNRWLSWMTFWSTGPQNWHIISNFTVDQLPPAKKIMMISSWFQIPVLIFCWRWFRDPPYEVSPSLQDPKRPSAGSNLCLDCSNKHLASAFVVFWKIRDWENLK